MKMLTRGGFHLHLLQTAVIHPNQLSSFPAFNKGLPPSKSILFSFFSTKERESEIEGKLLSPFLTAEFRERINILLFVFAKGLRHSTTAGWEF